ncbi:MAG: proline racemase family protein [Planctomycetota bacterium]
MNSFTDSVSVRFVDSHTEGEPTRLIIEGGPELGQGTLAERKQRFALTADEFRRSVLSEPRGFEAMVGALLCDPVDAESAAGVIFFNNAGFLNMCGHGAIGVAASLFHLGRVGLGRHKLDTPVGKIEFELLSPNRVAIANVPSFRLHRDVELSVGGVGRVVGDVAWGGNWFFLTKSIQESLFLGNLDQLTKSAVAIRKALEEQGITGSLGAEIDHIELVSTAENENANARNFVLCPGTEYDRSPCGTGTSAKVACLADDGELEEGEVWVQESVIGSRFEATYRLDQAEPNDEGGVRVLPTITGHAYVCSAGEIYRHPDDPFRDGIPKGTES